MHITHSCISNVDSVTGGFYKRGCQEKTLLPPHSRVRRFGHPAPECAASSVPERGQARRVLENRNHRICGSSCRVEAPVSSTVASANHSSIGDSRPIALLGCPRGHTVAEETVCLTRKRILTLEPVRSATARSSRKMVPPNDPVRGDHAACGFTYSAWNGSPFFQTHSAIAAILRASVSRAMAGCIPFTRRFS